MKFIKEILKAAGELLLEEQNRVEIVVHKEKNDFATSADLLSEKFLIDRIMGKYKDHAIYSEEVGGDGIESDYRWVIDPLDGTKEFTRNIPLFNVSLALEHRGELVASGVGRPFEKVIFSGARNVGSFKNNSQIKVADENRLENSVVYCYLPSYVRNPNEFDKNWSRLGELAKKVYRLRSLADENTAICWVAQGGADAYVNLGNPPKWYDIAPGILIAKEAGATVKNEKGEDLREDNYKNVIVACNENVYEQIMKIL